VPGNDADLPALSSRNARPDGGFACLRRAVDAQVWSATNRRGPDTVTFLLLGLIVFIGIHAFTLARESRAALVGRLGHTGYKLGYSALSILGFVLLWWGYGAYRTSGYIPVWDAPVWTRHLALLVMLPVFPILLAAYLPGRIRSTLKHPMILAVKTWALAHLLANGDLGSIIMFGTFLAWAVVAFMSMRRRTGDNGLLVPLPPPRPINDIIAVAGGLAIYLAFVMGTHRALIGVGVLS
jgi:uncharacterized membrane protein